MKKILAFFVLILSSIAFAFGGGSATSVAVSTKQVAVSTASTSSTKAVVAPKLDIPNQMEEAARLASQVDVSRVPAATKQLCQQKFGDKSWKTLLALSSDFPAPYPSTVQACIIMAASTTDTVKDIRVEQLPYVFFNLYNGCSRPFVGDRQAGAAYNTFTTGNDLRLTDPLKRGEAQIVAARLLAQDMFGGCLLTAQDFAVAMGAFTASTNDEVAAVKTWVNSQIAGGNKDVARLFDSFQRTIDARIAELDALAKGGDSAARDSAAATLALSSNLQTFLIQTSTLKSQEFCSDNVHTHIQIFINLKGAETKSTFLCPDDIKTVVPAETGGGAEVAPKQPCPAGDSTICDCLATLTPVSVAIGSDMLWYNNQVVNNGAMRPNVVVSGKVYQGDDAVKFINDDAHKFTSADFYGIIQVGSFEKHYVHVVISGSTVTMTVQ